MFNTLYYPWTTPNQRNKLLLSWTCTMSVDPKLWLIKQLLLVTSASFCLSAWGYRVHISRPVETHFLWSPAHYQLRSGAQRGRTRSMGALTRYILLVCERRLLGKHVGSGGEDMMGLIYNRLQEHKNELVDRRAASHVRKYT